MALSHIEEQWWHRPATSASKHHTNKQSTHRVEIVHKIVHTVGDGTESYTEELWWCKPAMPASKRHTNKQSTHCVEVVHETGDGTESYTEEQ